MSFLSLIQGACDLIGLTRPTIAMASLDQNVRTLVGLANVEGQELLERHAWEETSKETTFTTVAAELQGVLTTLAPGFNYIVNETMWDRTLNRPVPGPLSPTERQRLIASNSTGPFQKFYMRGGSLYFFPEPPAGNTIAFEYQSAYWCQSSGGTDQSAWAADTDTGILDENLMKLGVVWRWKKKTGLDYSEDFRTYEEKVANKMGRGGGKRTLDMSGAPVRPVGVAVPEGSWDL